jgi:D-alanyl-D-alanine carboxypeptidase (penicillin-binding protein 5/6)
MWKKGLLIFISLIMFASMSVTGVAAENSSNVAVNQVPDLAPHARAAVIMDASTGKIIYQKNMNQEYPPASITKIMTMLLIMDALESKKITMNEMVRTSDYAASMGGSQIFLEPGEEMTVRDMLKGIAMASANDACVAMAEKIAGTEDAFVNMMNNKAKQLGMTHTHFVNSNGLPAKGHYTSAHDIAIMSRALLKHQKILQFTSKYQDYLRKNTERPFWLVNTNKLVRFYPGVDGLKTGFTSDAKFCLSATAKQKYFRVIAVVLGEPNTKTRNAEVSNMFDYAFAQYTSYQVYKRGQQIGTLVVEKGKTNKIPLIAQHQYSVLLKKGQDQKGIKAELKMDENVKAPLKKGQPIGKIVVTQQGKTLEEFPLTSPVDVEKAGWWTLFKRTVKHLVLFD